jgi:hypothetical protein
LKRLRLLRFRWQDYEHGAGSGRDNSDSRQPFLGPQQAKPRQRDADELHPELTVPGDQQLNTAALLQGRFESLRFAEDSNGA